MIVSNQRRFFRGGYSGIIHAAAIRCMVTTSHSDVIVCRIVDDVPGKADELLAEAVLQTNLKEREIESIHMRVLHDLDRHGEVGLDPGAALEATFASVQSDGLVVKYENYARILLS